MAVEKSSEPRQDKTDFTQTRWIAGIAAGAAGLGGTVVSDEAYGGIVILDNGGSGWSLDQPAYSTVVSANVATNLVDIGTPGEAAILMQWFNDPIGQTAAVVGSSAYMRILPPFIRSTASATPGPLANFGTFSAYYAGIRDGSNAYTSGSIAGSDNWLRIAFLDSGIDPINPRSGWLQLENVDADTIRIAQIVFSDQADFTVHLTGAGGLEEVPQPTPAPGGLALMAAGAGGLLALRRRRKSERGEQQQASTTVTA